MRRNRRPGGGRRRAGAMALWLAASLAVVAAVPAASEASPATTTRRVDLARPTFSDPTAITNPLFPMSELTSVVQLGHEGDVALRHEITLLSGTRAITWRGQRVETVRSQFVAYGDGRILEVAVDYFAQADDGSVWYFGEDVDNYEDGVIADHDGTWLAGRDGPPGMIMPARPAVVGDVYRPENIPGVVFEEVTVKAVDRTVAGPSGPVRGAITVQERLLDGVLEDKEFAPGYGEFSASVPTEDEQVTVAVAAPTDAVDGGLPRPLRRLTRSARAVFDAASHERWDRLSRAVDGAAAAWERYSAEPVSELLAAQVDDRLEALAAAVADHEPADVRQAALDLGHASLDLQLRHRPVTKVDRARYGVWLRQVLVDGAADDLAAVQGDIAVLEALSERFA